MRCPKCGFEMQEGQLYCEHCGMEIQIVPDFEPEIENSISETLNTLAEELTQKDTEEPETTDEVQDDDFIGEDAHIFEKLLSNRKVFFVCTMGLTVLVIALFLTVFFFHVERNESGR